MDGIFTLVQSSSAQSALPVLRNLIANGTSPVLLFCLLYPPESLLGEKINDRRVKVFDWTDRVPGYRTQDYSLPNILDAVQPGASDQFEEFQLSKI
jgi:elongator complex protein 5